MDTATQTHPALDQSGVDLIPWFKTLLDYTDVIVGDIPEDDAALDWRPTDEADGWYFSIREQAMHIADTRHSAVGWITGNPEDDDKFCTKYGGTGEPWQFRTASREEILASLKAGREKVDAWLGRPMSELLGTSKNLIQEHQKQTAQMREQGKIEEAAARESRGPASIISQLVFICAHEQSHRSVLQTLLRQRGLKVTRYA